MKRTEKVRKEGLDKFYTIPSVVDTCLSTVEKYYNWVDWDLVVEPSAGAGSFFTKVKSHKKIGIDIEPEHKDIVKLDFFNYTPSPGTGKNILVIGNPPFGKVSSLAIKFFNHAAEWASVIAFIIPRTFRRTSVQNKLNRHFHLIHDEGIPTQPCAFEPPMMVKCCFQIWEKRGDKPRDILLLPTQHPHWDFLPFGPLDENGQPTPPQGADFAIRAYGGKCGEIRENDLHTLRPKSWHWIRCNGIIERQVLIERFKSLDYSNSLNTARQNSMGKGELIALYTGILNT